MTGRFLGYDDKAMVTAKIAFGSRTAFWKLFSDEGEHGSRLVRIDFEDER